MGISNIESTSNLNLRHSEYPFPLSQSKEGTLIADEGKLGMYSVREALHVPVVPSVLSEHAL